MTLEDVWKELRKLQHMTELSIKQGLTVKEASIVSGIGQCELRRRCNAPETSPWHIKNVRVGNLRPRIVIPRCELDRILKDEAR